MTLIDISCYRFCLVCTDQEIIISFFLYNDIIIMMLIIMMIIILQWHYNDNVDNIYNNITYNSSNKIVIHSNTQIYL